MYTARIGILLSFGLTFFPAFLLAQEVPCDRKSIAPEATPGPTEEETPEVPSESEQTPSRGGSSRVPPTRSLGDGKRIRGLGNGRGSHPPFPTPTWSTMDIFDFGRTTFCVLTWALPVRTVRLNHHDQWGSPPLNANEFNTSAESQLGSAEKSEDSIAGANIRFRYSPTIHVDQWLRVHSTVDILDNLVLGSTPDYAELRPDASFSLFAGSQAPPSDGRNSLSDSLRVKEAFADIDTLLGNIRVGRMASHWGLGILANGGKSLDSDFGDYVDRALFTTRIGSVYTALAMDFVAEGVVAADADYAFGQPYDADNLDDVNQGVLAFFSRPMTDEEKALRQRDLYELRKPVFDWGIYTVLRTQDYDISNENQPTYAPEVENALGFSDENTVNQTTYEDFAFVNRSGWGVIPDLWARFQWSPNRGQLLRIETEWAMVIGEVENVDSTVGPDATANPKEIEQWGGVLQTEFQANGNVSVFLESGVASGDDAEYFAVKDQVNYGESDATGNLGSNRKVTNFKFDRNYYTDLLLFREVIGAVTNTVYVKPGVMYDLFDSREDALGFRFDVLTAFALEPEATPGNDGFYGVEFDTQLFYEEANRFRADLSWGTLVPGAAFNLAGRIPRLHRDTGRH